MQRDLAACEPLGSLVPGLRPLEGKSFYLHEVKSQSCSLLTNLIVRLGGKVESFFYKDVNIVVTGNRDALTTITAPSREVKGYRSPCGSGNAAPRAGTPRAPVCGSRGKALLEKVISNKEQSQGGVLFSAARYWGAKIVSVDQFLKVVDDLNSHRSAHIRRRREGKNSSLHVIKAGSLKGDFVKVEDSSRKYRPLHGQSLDFPLLSYTRRFSPFENPAPVHPGKTREDELGKDKFRNSEEPISSHDKPSAAPSPKPSHRRKSLGFCECCQMKYKDQDEHLQSDVHRRFVEDANSYGSVDQLVAAMDDVFSRCKDVQGDAAMTWLSVISEAPPSESEQRCRRETEPNQEAEPGSHVDVQKECVCDSSAVPQPSCVDSPPHTSSGTKFTDEKRNPVLHSESGIPSPRPQPVCHTAPSPALASDGHELCTLASLNHDRGTSTWFKSSKHHQEDTAHSVEEHTLQEVTNSHSPSFKSLCCSLPSRISDGVNPKKRSRLFTLSPRTSKVRRINLCSDPTNQNSGTDVRFKPVQQNEIKEHAEVNTRKCDVEPCLSTNASLTNMAASQDNLSFRNDNQKEPVCQTFTNSVVCDVSSELAPPQLYPFFHDDVYQNQTFLDPPKLAPSVTSSASVLSQSFSSICIDSALVPDTFSPSSSESDWDSGLLSRLAPPLHLQPRGDRCELDLGLLLQGSCSGMQDGSYTSRLYSVLQPNMSSHADYADPKNVYRPMEVMDRRIIQSLGV